MLFQKMPCYVTRVETPLATDKIRPYGGELHISSEKEEKKIILQLLNPKSSQESISEPTKDN